MSSPSEGQIAVTLPDGSSRALPTGSTAGDLARSIARGLAKKAVIAEVNGVERDLDHQLADGDAVSIVTSDTDQGLYVIRHSTAHVLAQAVLDLYPGATFGIGPPVENGFYYDFELPDGGTFSDEDLAAIEARMREILAESQPFVKDEISADDARKVFADHKYKLEIIDNASTDPMSATSDRGEVRVYENPPPSPRPNQTFHGHDGFIDLCRGPHVPTTSDFLGHFSLLRVAGAYWRGDEKNPQLQRIYGTAWATDKELKQHLQQIAEAAKRDHRKLGVELDLFSFPDEIGSGLPVFHPKGATIKMEMENYARQRHVEAGYSFVSTPHITKAHLFETSKHLEWYADGMFPPMHLDEVTDDRGTSAAGLLPQADELPDAQPRCFSRVVARTASCRCGCSSSAPCTATRSQVWSRASPGPGASRRTTRTSTAPESRCTTSWPACSGSCSTCSPTTASTSSTSSCRPRDPEKSVGDDADLGGGHARCWPRWPRHPASIWSTTRAGPPSTARRSPCRRATPSAVPGSCRPSSSTSSSPQLFDLKYVGADRTRHQPVMIHRALFGSIERFFGVLLEHYAGAFPTWLSPVQAGLPGGRRTRGLRRPSVADQLRGRRACGSTWSAADEPLGARIRKPKLEKVPHILVVGGDDVEHGTVGDNARGGDEPERDIPVADFVERSRHRGDP